MKRDRKIIFIISIALVVSFLLGILIYSNSGATKLKKQLDLGRKYLTELDYEQAIASFKKAIDINPMSEDAYLGLADALEALARQEKEQGNIELAITYLEQLTEALEAGYHNTNDESIKIRLDEMQALLNEWKKEKADAIESDLKAAEQEKQDQLWAEVQAAMEHLQNVESQPLSRSELNSNRTTADTERLCRDSINIMQNYLNGIDEAKEDAFKDSQFYIVLSKAYYLTGELDKCLEIRKRGYEKNAYFLLEPSEHIINDWVYDEYGRSIYYSDKTTLHEYEGNQIKCTKHYRPEDPGYGVNERYCEYEDGRLVKVYGGTTGGEYPFIYNCEIEYSGNHATVRETGEHIYGTVETIWEVTFNEYGNVIEVEIISER